MYGVTEIIANPTPLDTANSAVSLAQPLNIAPTNAALWHSTFESGNTAASGIRVDHKSTIGYPPFWRGVNLIANAVSGLPCDVFRRDGDDREIATAHPAQKLIKRLASPIMRANDFRKTMTSHALLFGNGFAWIERQNSRPTALWVLDPQRMMIRYMDGELWYMTTIEGEQKRFPGRDVLHVKGLSHNGITGYSIIDIMKEHLGVGLAAARFGARFFGDGSNMSGILMVPGHFSEEKIRNTMSSWQDMSGKLSNSHKIALLQDGVKFQPYTVAPEQAQFLGTRNYEVRATVASILGVPPHLLGDDSRTSHNSLEAENQSFLQHSLDPWLTEWEGEYACKLLSDREQDRSTHFVEFNREAAIQMLFKEKIDGIYRQIEMGLLSLNEGRRLINMASIGDEGDKRFHPANWMELTDEEPEPEPAPVIMPMEPEEPAEEPEEEPAEQAANVLRAVLASNVTDALKTEQKLVVSAVKRGGKHGTPSFMRWAENFYDKWTTKAVASLDSPAAIEAKQRHAEESKRQLLDVACVASDSTLVDQVTEVVATWDGRSEKLTMDLMKATTCN